MIKVSQRMQNDFGFWHSHAHIQINCLINKKKRMEIVSQFTGVTLTMKKTIERII